jgi:hypothetical protein
MAVPLSGQPAQLSPGTAGLPAVVPRQVPDRNRPISASPSVPPASWDSPWRPAHPGWRRRTGQNGTSRRCRCLAGGDAFDIGVAERCVLGQEPVQRVQVQFRSQRLPAGGDHVNWQVCEQHHVPMAHGAVREGAGAGQSGIRYPEKAGGALMTHQARPERCIPPVIAGLRLFG